MQHDRKPGRVRVLDNGPIAGGRRHGDLPAAAAAGKGTKPGGGSMFVSVLLFMVGSAIGGASIAWFGIGLP